MSDQEPQKLTYNTLIAQAEALDSSPLVQSHPELRDLLKKYVYDLRSWLAAVIDFDGAEDYTIDKPSVLEAIKLMTDNLQKDINSILSAPPKICLPPERIASIEAKLRKDYDEQVAFLLSRFLIKDGGNGVFYYIEVKTDDPNAEDGLVATTHYLPTWEQIKAGLLPADYHFFHWLASMDGAPMLQLTPLAYSVTDELHIITDVVNHKEKERWDSDFKDSYPRPPASLEIHEARRFEKRGVLPDKVSLTQAGGPLLRVEGGQSKREKINRCQGWFVEIVPRLMGPLASQPHEGGNQPSDPPLQQMVNIHNSLPDFECDADTVESAILSHQFYIDSLDSTGIYAPYEPITLCFPGSLINGDRHIPVCQIVGNQFIYGKVGPTFEDSTALESLPESIVTADLLLSHRPVRRLTPKKQ